MGVVSRRFAGPGRSSQSASASRSQFRGAHTGAVGPHTQGTRTGTGTRVQTQTQAQGRRVGHRILAVWDETRLYEVCRACKRVAVGGVLAAATRRLILNVAYGSARLIGDLLEGGRRRRGRAGVQAGNGCYCCRWCWLAGWLSAGCDQCRCEQARKASCPRFSFSTLLLSAGWLASVVEDCYSLCRALWSAGWVGQPSIGRRESRSRSRVVVWLITWRGPRPYPW